MAPSLLPVLLLEMMAVVGVELMGEEAAGTELMSSWGNMAAGGGCAMG